MQVLVARQLVQSGDDERHLGEGVAGSSSLDAIVRQDLERQLKAAIQFVLPLFDQAARADHQAAGQVAARDQLLDDSPAMIVLPAPGSSASRKRSGCRGSIFS